MRKAILIGGLLTVGMANHWAAAQENVPAAGQPPVAPNAEVAAQYSYSIGLQVGTTFHTDGVAIDIDSLLAGVKDGLSAAKPKYEQEALDKALEELGRYRMQVHIARNREYVEKNKQVAGVKVLPSGLQYKVLKSGVGAMPTSEDRVRVHYRGQLVDGRVFDSSYERSEPFVTQVNQVIPGWTEALQMMKVGDKWQLVIPSELGYGETGFGDAIPPFTTLVFEVELLGIE